MRFLRNALLSSTLLLGLGASAQVYHNPNPYTEERSDRVIDRVRSDLDQAMNMGDLNRFQRNTLAQASSDLRAVDRQLDRGYFNRQELNGAIGRIQSVMNSGRISEEQRAMLRDDVRRLRSIRQMQAGNWRP